MFSENESEEASGALLRNKRIRLSEFDGDTRSSKLSYDIPDKTTNISLDVAQPGKRSSLVHEKQSMDKSCQQFWEHAGSKCINILGVEKSAEQDNGFQASQMTNVSGEGDTINAVGAGEMESVTVPSGMTSDDVLGDTVPSTEMESMRRVCYDFLDPNSRGPEVPPFPGSHPVFLSRDNLQLLRQEDYYTTWKADGTRYMMLITLTGCYLIDRNFEFRSVKLRFPCGNANEGATGNTHNVTLLDGEIVIDTDLIKNKQERVYLIFDMIVINGKSLVDQPFSRRWEKIENEVIKPRNTERDVLFKSSNPYYSYELELFRVRRKEFYQLSAVPKLLKELMPHLPHASDGLIFQPQDAPYVPLTYKRLLKWKYPEMNSLDFLLEVGNNNRPMLYLNERGRIMDESHVTFRDPSPSVDVSFLSGKIIECSWDSKVNEWVFMRLRPNKSTPNEFSTYEEVYFLLLINTLQCSC